VRREILEGMEDRELQQMPAHIISEARGFRRQREREIRERQRQLERE